MTYNIGNIDRLLRAGAGVLLIVLAATGVISVWGYLGLILLATAAFRFCPAYRLLGVNTCSLPKK